MPLFVVLLAAALAAAAPAQIPTKSYAQQLVDETAVKNPSLLVIVMEAAPPKTSGDDVVVASNIGRIGAKARDDRGVIESGRIEAELTGGGTRFAVKLPLRDASGDVIGALMLAFRYKGGDDQAALRKTAEKIGDRLSRRILNQANLFDPYPFDPLATTKTHAQKLVDEAMARHSDLLSLAMHVTLPASQDNIILGSSFGRLGKKADEDDMQVIRTGKELEDVYDAGKRYGLELPLQDARGETIGALTVAYAYKAGEYTPTLRHRAEQLRNELREEIDSAQQLVTLDP